MIRTTNVKGPMDIMMQVNHEKIKQTALAKQSLIKEALRLKTWNSISKWMCEAEIAFNAICHPSFSAMIHDIGEYVRSMLAPTYHVIREDLFRNRLQEADDFVASYKVHWETYGCSLMSDFWTDGKGRSLINFLVDCPKDTTFLKSMDASAHIKDANLIVEMVNEVIKVVGADNIIQFVTNNGSNF